MTSLETSIGIAHGPTMDDGEIITGTLVDTGRLDKALAAASGLSRERVKGLIADGAVEIGGKPAKSGSAKAEAGTVFTIALPLPFRPDTAMAAFLLGAQFICECFTSSSDLPFEVIGNRLVFASCGMPAPGGVAA